MSEWAYKECEKCKSRIHINFTCKSYSNKNMMINKCNGDPWKERKKSQEIINSLLNKNQKLKEQLEENNIALKWQKERFKRL